VHHDEAAADADPALVADEPLDHDVDDEALHAEH
jgi:hypothetical protein